MTTPLSCYVLTLNSERRLRQVLESVRDVADEILVVDSGSTDATIACAEQFGARIVMRPFDNFRNQRVFAEANCRYDWILQIDSDEVVSPRLAETIAALKAADFDAAQDPPPDGFSIEREWLVLGRKVHTFYPIRAPDRVVRLLRRDRIGHHDARIIHESPGGAGQHLRPIDGPLLHYTCDSIDQMFEKVGLYTRLSALDLHAHGERASWAKIHLYPWLIALRYWTVMGGWRDGAVGLIHAGYVRHTIHLKYLKLRYDVGDDRTPGAPQDG